MGSERQIGSTSALARSLLDLCRSRRLTLATAESCTGGLVAGALTDIPGSSDVVDRGFVTYSNEAKRAMLGVNATTPDELKRAVNVAMDSGKPTLINAVIDPAAGSESGRIGNLNPQSALRKK